MTLPMTGRTTGIFERKGTDGENTFSAAGTEKLSNETLSEQLGRYQRQARIWLRVGLLGIVGGLIAAIAVRDAALKVVLFGGGLCCVLFLSGGAQKKLKSLMQEQLGDFFRAELKKSFGPDLHTGNADRPAASENTSPAGRKVGGV